MPYVKIRHRCSVPQVLGHGDLWRCDECGRLWRSRAPGNPAYECWRHAGWITRWLNTQWKTVGGYPSSSKPNSQLKPPPASICRPKGQMEEPPLDTSWITMREQGPL